MIRGRTVGLRPVEPGDLTLLRDLANDAHVGGLVVGWDFPVSLHGQTQWLDAAAHSRSTFRLMIDDLNTGDPIGLTGLWEIDWHNQSAQTATKIRTDSTGQGLGTDAILTVMAWAFYVVGLRRLHSTILAFNEPSLKAYVGRCGWRIEGRERESTFRKGRWHDLYRVAALRGDFESLRDRDEYVERVCPVDTDAVFDYPK